MYLRPGLIFLSLKKDQEWEFVKGKLKSNFVTLRSTILNKVVNDFSKNNGLEK